MTNCPHCSGAIDASIFNAASIELRKLASTDERSQLEGMLQELRDAGPRGVTTEQFRAAGYYMSNSRIWQLRHKWGANIKTELFNGYGRDNVFHCRLARYFLISEPTMRPEPKQAKMGRKPGGDACNS